MPDIPTPIPDSLAQRIDQWRRQSCFDVVWQLAVVIAAITIAAALVSLGSVGVILGFLIVAFMFRDPIHDALADVWDRDFWRL